MMWRKALLFGDKLIAGKVLKSEDPKEVKGFGRKVTNFDGKLWDQHKSQIVIDGNLLKFKQNPNLWEKLKRTGNRTLVEASPMDKVFNFFFLFFFFFFYDFFLFFIFFIFLYF